MLPNLTAKNIYVCDWDGTLFHSMPAKTESFGKVLASMVPSLSEADGQAVYRRLSGIPRREIFITVLAENGMKMDDEALDGMSQKLTKMNKVALEKACLFFDALPFLEALLALGKTVYLSSSVPQEELSYFANRKIAPELLAGISGIFGSQLGFTKGRLHVARILEQTGRSHAECVMIGDDLADIELAEDSAIDSVLVDRENRFNHVENRVTSLNEVINCIK